MMNLKSLLLFQMFLFFLLPCSVGARQQIKPHHVIIQSSFQEKNAVPPFNHQFDLQSSKIIHEPFFPDIRLSPYDLPLDFPQNTNVSRFSMSFGNLSEVFLGAEGVLENAILLYQQGDLDKAEEKLISLLPSSTKTGKKATLWLAWIKFKKNQWDACLTYSQSLHQSVDLDLSRESYYLSSLTLIKQERFKENLSLLNSLQIKTHRKNWDFRLSHAYLISLINLRYWNDARDFLDKLEIENVSHAKQYYQILEISGLVHYYLNHYQDSLKDYSRTRELNKSPAFQNSTLRTIGWLRFFLKNFEETIETVNKLQARPLIKLDNEMKYLKLASLAHLRHWNELKTIFSDIPQESPFYKYSSFKIYTLLKNSTAQKTLKTQVSALKYNFPEMKFHSSLQKGNSYFANGKYINAEKHYLRALSVYTDDSSHEIVQYNIGLTHLKQKQFSLASKDFIYLLPRRQYLNPQKLSYHLLYSLYRAGEAKKFMKYCNPLNLSTFNKDLQWEIRFMKGGMLLLLSGNKAAAREYLWVWKNNRKIDAFEFALKAYYQERDFHAIVKLIEDNPDARSKKILSYQIRSLLGIGRFKEALNTIEKQDLTDNQFIRLRLEVWLANRLYKKIIANVSQLLNRTLNAEDRRLFYLSLGDAYFNLRNYPESKNQFYKALNLTSDSTEKSLILYNIALTTYYCNNFQGFLKETDVILKSKKLSPEVRYNLIQLLVAYYEQTQQRSKADTILEQYTQTSNFQRAKVRIKRIHLLSQAGAYEKCHKLALISDPTETLFQRRDRIIQAGHCGIKMNNSRSIIPLLKKELHKDNNTYRKPEMQLIIATAHFNVGQYKQSLKQSRKLLSKNLNSKAALETQLLLVDNLIHLNKYLLASKELGEISQYRNSKFHAKALFLSASILVSQHQPENAVRVLLRIYYLKQSKPEEKLSALVKITEIFLDQNQMPEANKYFRLIDKNSVLKYDVLNTKYVKLQNRFPEDKTSPK